jgi:hypothetical protein
MTWILSKAPAKQIHVSTIHMKKRLLNDVVGDECKDRLTIAGFLRE